MMNKKHTNHHLSVFDEYLSIKIIKLLNDDDVYEIQKLSFLRDAAAPWQASPPGVPFKKGQHLPPSCRHAAPLDFTMPR